MATLAIIVTYNGMKWIERCILSIPQDVDVLVVDNNSTDGTGPYIKNHFPNVNIIELETNLGFGQANNTGIKYALNNSYEFVALINQDVYVFPDTLPEIQNIHRMNPDYGVLSCIHLNGDETDFDFNFVNKLHINHKLIYALYSESNNTNLYELPFINAAFWHVSMKLINDIGGFDPIFYHYGEDNNFCQRAIYHGYKIGITPRLKIIHDRETSAMLSKPELDKFRKNLHVKWADINYSLTNKVIIKQKLKLFIEGLVHLFSLEGAKFKISYSKFKCIRNSLPSIHDSRKRNILKGQHYLD